MPEESQARGQEPTSVLPAAVSSVTCLLTSPNVGGWLFPGVQWVCWCGIQNTTCHKASILVSNSKCCFTVKKGSWSLDLHGHAKERAPVCPPDRGAHDHLGHTLSPISAAPPPSFSSASPGPAFSCSDICIVTRWLCVPSEGPGLVFLVSS